MPKYRKMLSDINAPYLQSIMRLIETQSKMTLANWSIGYARAYILPIYEKSYPGDARCEHAFNAAVKWLEGKVKLPYVKNIMRARVNRESGSPEAQTDRREGGAVTRRLLRLPFRRQRQRSPRKPIRS